MLDRLKASPVYQQLRQWPPTSTTVIAGGLMTGVASYHFTGSAELAVFLAAAFKALCPQASDAADKALGLVNQLPAGLKK